MRRERMRRIALGGVVLGLSACNDDGGGAAETSMSGTSAASGASDSAGGSTGDAAAMLVPVSLRDYVVFDAPQSESLRAFIPRDGGGFTALLGRSRSSGGNAESEVSTYNAMLERQWTVVVAPSGGFTPHGLTTIADGTKVVIVGGNSTGSSEPQSISLTTIDANGTNTEDLGEFEGPVSFVLAVTPEGLFEWTQVVNQDARDVTAIGGEVVVLEQAGLHRWAADGTEVGTTPITDNTAFRLQQVAFDGTSALVVATLSSSVEGPEPFATVEGEPLVFDGSDGDGVLAGVDLMAGVQWARPYRIGTGVVTALGDGSSIVVHERSDAMVLVKNAVGSQDEQWRREANGATISWVSQDGAGNLALVGSHESRSHLENAEDPVVWITPRDCDTGNCSRGSFAASYTPDGELRWFFMIDSEAFLHSIVPANPGSWWVAGSYDGAVALGVGGPQLYPTANDDGDARDSFVLRLDEG